MSFVMKKENCLKELLIRYKSLSSSIIHYISEENNFDVNKADKALMELTGSIIIKREYSKPPRIENPDQYICVDRIEDCIDDILTGARILIILRGLPGSGKSYLAKSILRACYRNPEYKDHIYSADNFFMQNGRYIYDARQIGDAHQWNQNQVDYRMQEGYSPLIVDNTNTQVWEMGNYIGMAVRNGYKIHILEVNTRWAFNCNELTKKNQHNVPKQRIKAMLERYEMGITAEDLLRHYQCPLKYQNNPERRRCPPIESKNTIGNISNHNALNPDMSLPRSKKKDRENRPNGFFPVFHRNEKVSNKTPTKNTPAVNQRNPLDKVQQNGVFSSTKQEGTPSKSPFEFCWDTDLDQAIHFWTYSSPPKGNDVQIPEKKQTCDVGTNPIEFSLIPEKTLYGKSREICDTRKQVPPNKPGMLDKSSSTDNVVSDRDEDLKKLCDVFKNIPPVYIRDMYDDCHGNFDMTFEIFLEDNKDYSHLMFDLDNMTSKDNDVEKELVKELSRSSSVESLNEASALPQENLKITSSPSLLSSKNAVAASTGAIKKYSNLSPVEIRESECMTPDLSSDEEEISSLSPISDFYSDNEGESTTSKPESEDIELNLGQFLVKQLEKEFGDPSNNFPDGFQPVVQVPKGLARQLYAFYIESAYQQMEAQQCILDNLVKEDEAFARKLYEEEIGAVQKPPPEGLRDIMNEQAAIKFQQKQLPKLKTPNDLATLLTKKKLFESFPSVDQSVILQIYHANALNYKETVEDLIDSVGAFGIKASANVREPPISPSTIQELEEAQRDSKPAQVEKEIQKTPTQFREEAEFYLGKRNELYQKAQEHYNKGHKEVAQFYSQLAQQQTQYYDIANNKAASVFLDENSKRLQNMNTLDLHYLFVKEATSALDVFIDSNIDKLIASRGKTTQDLFIITGRGKRSMNGVSKIRPAIIRRLEARKIKYHKMNPGMLKIKIRRNTPVTNNL